ncbi:MAG: UvrD-helicase domain-containing protein [Clostridia bacterium]|nr:UvrD-helicase domain-containing protein [Clostridia bacterium]
MPEWTKDQERAFSYRGGELLVSAAAGSGKTAVLVQRILARLTDEERPEDISRFLVVTFTNAAAADMKDKIRAEISRRIAEDPGRRRLARQQVLLSSADIGTVDSFCFRLIRMHFQALGLPANLRIGGESECADLAERAMEETLSEAFAAGEESFLCMADQLSDTRDSGGLAALVRECYQHLMVTPDPEETARLALRNYDRGAENVAASPWGEELLRRLASAAKDAHMGYQCAIRRIEESGNCEKYLPVLYAERDALEGLLSAAETDWDSARSALLGVNFVTLPRVSGESEEKELVKRVRDRAKEELRSLAKRQFSEDSAAIRESLAEQRQVAEGLLGVTLRYAKKFREAKLERNIVDFNDVEHEAYRLLVAERNAETGEIRPTQVALDIGAGYCEVMVDEYQDTNALQDAIFRALTYARGNLFMVGDVKQSIYRFRQADPTVFLDKYRAFPPVETLSDAGSRRQNLSLNFRSRAEVLSAANFFFERLCIPEFSEIEYGREEMLYCARKDAPDRRYAAELHMVDDESDGGEWSEPRAVARRIAEMLSEGLPVAEKSGGCRPLQPGDVVILLRADGGRAARFAAELSLAGIPCRVEQDSGFCETLEIRTALACLDAVYNPLEDIALLAFLRCPGIAFTAEMLAGVRAKKLDGPLYDALVLAAGEDAECASALECLRELRRDAKELSVDRLLRRLSDRLCLVRGFRAMPGGERRRENLLTLFGHAEVFARNVGGDAHAFCAHIRRMAEHAERKEADVGGNAVRIMTIHRSKGLEFPVVIFACAAKAFNNDDRKAAVLQHRELGIGARRRDIARSLTFSTLPRDAIDLREAREDRAEELRVLYVAMTRPREKLLVFTSRPNRTTPRAWLERLRSDVAAVGISPHRLMTATNAGDWLWYAALSATEGGLTGFGENVFRAEAGPWQLIWNAAGDSVCPWSAFTEAASAPDSDISAEELQRRAFGSYAHPGAVRAPGKVTVTELKGREKDAELDAAAPPSPYGRPRFLAERQPLTGAERGTAVHMLLSQVDFAQCSRADICATLQRLTEREFISPAAAKAVDAEKIAAFFQSELGQRLCAAPDVLREFKFSLLVPAESVVDMAGETGESILLQGVADAVIRTPEKLIVIDYKTDRPFGAEDRGAWLKEKCETYRRQVELYADALGRIFRRPVAETWLCFLETGDNICLKGEETK